METLNSNNPAIVGVDVSKDKLDVYFLETKNWDSWLNTPAGLKKAMKSLKKINFSGLVVLESTGGYEKLCLQHLTDAGFSVHVAHPKRVYHFIQQKGYFAKTDKADAKAIAQYGQQEGVESTVVKDKAAQERQDLSARRAQLVETLVAEKCRLKDHLSASVKRSIKRTAKSLENEIKLIEKALEKSIHEDEELREKAERLCTFKGIAKRSASILISGLPELGDLTRQEVACLTGVAPRNNDSGRKFGKRVISGGRGHIRKTLYMVALSAIVHNAAMKNFYRRLKESGKPSKICLVAVMRKIIITLNAMLRDGKNWEVRPYAPVK